MQENWNTKKEEKKAGCLQTTLQTIALEDIFNDQGGGVVVH